MPLEIIGDNTCITSIKPTGKVVHCRGIADKYWLEIQFVDENNLSVVGLIVRPEYLPLPVMKMWRISLCRFN